MKLNVTGLKEDSTALGPSNDGTYAHIGSQGGTEMMMRGLRERVPADLLDNFNIICSRVREENISKDKKNILWLHDTWDDPESEHLHHADKRKRFAKLVFVSNYQQNTFNIGRGVPFADGQVLLNAIEPIPTHTKPKDCINLIYHTTPHRGLEILVPVFERICEIYTDMPIHLDVYSSFAAYGWAHRDEPYQKLFDRCRNHPSITYHGFQPNSVIREALQNAHIYSYPNIWPETSCISAIEAMSAGCTVVAPNHAVLPETCANFATMYPFNEDYNAHANIFINALMFAIREFHDENNQNKLKFQKMYFDNFYNWDVRANQWKGFLSAMLSSKE
jgi:UDP-glucose:(glucosyl)LPS alpha-1,2-glucosyltransferase